jgi:hypothetical protein
MNRLWNRVVGVAGLGSVLGLSGGCNTGAIGVKECREIETPRCTAEATCGHIDDIPACERYVRDHCLHGIAGPKVPTPPELEACLALIDAAQTCAEDNPSMLASRCDEFDEDALTPIADASRARTVCDVIGRPWAFEPCAFLNEEQSGNGGDEN